MKNKSINSILVFIANQIERLEGIVDETKFEDAEKNFEGLSENREAILDEMAGILAAVDDIRDIFERDEELPMMQASCSENVK